MDTTAIRDRDLLNQIAAYAGAINRHQNKATGGVQRPGPSRHHVWTPYTAARAQHDTSTKQRPQSSRHRTLVLAGAKDHDNGNVDDTTHDAPRWVSSRARGHMTLTNAAIYDSATAKKLAARAEAREKRRQAKLRKKEAQESDRLKRLAQTTLTHEGITYRFNRKYNLLIRQNIEDVASRPTPLRTTIHGVVFLKSPKSDNLFRKSTVKLHAKGRNQTLRMRPCRYYCRDGVCRKLQAGGTCPYQHDPAVRAVCPSWLQGGCVDESCTLIHDGGTAHNLPDCIYHLKSGDAVGCTRQDCRYSHDRDPSVIQPVNCPDFARVGYCSRGGACTQRHVREGRIARVSIDNCNDEDDNEEEQDSDYSTDSFTEEDFDETAFDDDYIGL